MYQAFKRFIKHLLLKSSNKYYFLNTSANCKHRWYGNSYGGFYVNPTLLNENSIVYSFGIGEDISFDKAIIEKHNCQVFGFDPTPKSINWIENQELPANFNFLNYGLSEKSGLFDFYLPKNPDWVSGSMVIQDNLNTNEKISVEMKSLEDIVKELGHEQIDVLKMDIEGSEYNVIDSILDSKVFVNQILIEFHDRFFENGVKKTQQAIMKLKEHGYEIFAVSSSYEEISLIHKDSI